MGAKIAVANQYQHQYESKLVQGKVALVYGATGAVGSTIARAFAREGAQVFLSGRRPSEVDSIAKKISSSGGIAEAAEVDALD